MSEAVSQQERERDYATANAKLFREASRWLDARVKGRVTAERDLKLTTAIADSRRAAGKLEATRKRLAKNAE